MAEIKVHPDGYPVSRWELQDGHRWLGIWQPPDGFVTAHVFTDEEAADWPRLVMEETRD